MLDPTPETGKQRMSFSLSLTKTTAAKLWCPSLPAIICFHVGTKGNTPTCYNTWLALLSLRATWIIFFILSDIFWLFCHAHYLCNNKANAQFKNIQKIQNYGCAFASHQLISLFLLLNESSALSLKLPVFLVMILRWPVSPRTGHRGGCMSAQVGVHLWDRHRACRYR